MNYILNRNYLNHNEFMNDMFFLWIYNYAELSEVKLRNLV